MTTTMLFNALILLFETYLNYSQGKVGSNVVISKVRWEHGLEDIRKLYDMLL